MMFHKHIGILLCGMMCGALFKCMYTDVVSSHHRTITTFSGDYDTTNPGFALLTPSEKLNIFYKDVNQKQTCKHIAKCGPNKWTTASFPIMRKCKTRMFRKLLLQCR